MFKKADFICLFQCTIIRKNKNIFIIFLSIIVDFVSHINGETALLGYLTKPILGLFGLCAPIIGAYSLVFAYFCYKYRDDQYTTSAKAILSKYINFKKLQKASVSPQKKDIRNSFHITFNKSPNSLF